MGFEKFDESGSGRGRTPGAEPMISLRKSGSIGINQAALDEYFEDVDGAVMYYDDENDQIGIEPVTDTDADEAAYTVSRSESGGTIAPKAFLRKYELIPDVTTQYDPRWNEDNQLVVIDVDDPAKTYGSPDEEDEDEQ